ncbi:ABC transporter substrate-binding protein [Kingella kingae]|uniref:ABC transporter substrate-binding protein n=1 Tax=Kingella kingae TaxID=504 RepID=UPI000408A8F2|nr:ABC transporter substrate-binding protein [Kingella kingae]MDK4544856.1 ABC transporter substrate-binding protein [Kingella kingae]MDK4567039.1 ABC transporter substrate-binding protein [Kingella kingae]MDK4628772.1 ABC transporter substrate-binding protein [Kingella kingae]MDK4636659.1 ABC transporter substrate-binding protein [Kingella kingae]MDK4638515.1 ABC transporter substrate-binding protein [Kingella kingae]
MHTRRDFLKLSALFTATAAMPLLQACGKRAATQPNAPVTIGYLPILDAAPLLVAHGKGLFQQCGVETVKPVLFRSWASLVEAFLSGQVNLIHVLSPMSVWMRYGSRAPVRALMWNHTCGSALTVRPDVNQLYDLQGQTVAIPFWYSVHNVVLQQLLRQAGLQIVEKNPQAGQVRLTVMPPSDMVAGLAAKQIAGFIVAEPFNALAESKGVGKILRFSGDIWKEHACCLTMMHDHDIQNRPYWVQNVVSALVDAAAFAKHHRAETAELLAKQGIQKYTPHDVNVLRNVLQPELIQWANYERNRAIVHTDWQKKRIDFQPFPFQSYSELLIKLLKETHLAGVNTFLQDVQPEIAAKELFDTRFVQAALGQGDLMQQFGLQGFERKEIFEI